MGLRVSLPKTEISAFTTGGIPANATLRIGGEVIPIGSLARITANIGGPGEARRRAYATAAMAVVMYKAPIWANTVARDRWIPNKVRKLQRQLALRTVRGYRTISHDAAAILARMVPFNLEADRLRRSYLRRRQVITENGVLSPRERDNIMKVERRRSLWRWRVRLAELPASGPGALVCGAIAEHLEGWVEKGHGTLTYRITQVLTGHGVFESYLFKIGRP